MRSSNLLRPRAARCAGMAVVAGVLTALVAGCTSNVAPPTKSSGQTTVASSGSSVSVSAPVSSSTSAAPKKTGPPAKPVHIKLFNVDSSTYGVGMPVIAFFSKRITSAKALQQATTATVNGTVMHGAWYFETSEYLTGYPVEGHYRLQNFWPAHASVLVKINAKGVSAGQGLAFDDSLFSSWSTGPANISVVDDGTHQMTVTSDGKNYGTFPVSLGASDTPTAHGVKVIMDKGKVVRMTGPGYNDCCVKFTQRLTYGGEYLHSAPWNCKGSAGCTGPGNHIGSADSSNGCTNLKPADAIKLYSFLRIGDVVNYPNANGPAMTLGAGYGDWNIPWSEWQTGGLVSTLG